MFRSSKIIIPAMLYLAVFVFSASLRAEIYKWTDADGNVHFGDKPLDHAQASEASPVQLKENYRPAARSVQEQEAYDREQQEIRRVSEARRQEREGKLAEEKVEREHRKKELCAAYAKDIQRLSTQDTTGSVPTYYYATDEDGKPVSSARQREIVEELKAASAAAGC